ncbi:putative reverse transcriptase domain-containing protein, partial [Tanacetum coccineum]
TQRFNELDLMCPRMVEPERVKVDAYIRGLTDNIKSEVTSFKPANLNEAIRVAHKQKQGNARAMVTAPTDGKLPLCECCFTRHVGQWTIKCHKCWKVRHKARHCKEKNVATGANALPILTCYDCGKQGHTRNRCPKKGKKEKAREVRGRAYAIKDAEPQGLNVVTDLMSIELGTFDVIISMDWLVKQDAVIVCGKDNKDKSEQNQSKPTRNGKGKTRVKNESQNQSRISPIQVNEDPNESQRINVDKFSKLKGSFGCFKSPRV